MELNVLAADEGTQIVPEDDENLPAVVPHHKVLKIGYRVRSKTFMVTFRPAGCRKSGGPEIENMHFE